MFQRLREDIALILERDPAARDRDRMNGYVSNSAGSV